MNDPRARRFHNLEQHLSSILAKIDIDTSNDGLRYSPANTRSHNPEQNAASMVVRTPAVEEYSPANTYSQTPDGGFLCTFPGCVVKSVFNSKARLEYAYALYSSWVFSPDRANLVFRDHQLQHFPKKFPCLTCDQVFERMECCRTQQHSG